MTDSVRGVLLALVILLGGCASPGEVGPTEDGGAAQRFPDVIDARLDPAGDGWRLSATISSPYDTAERYADAFRATTRPGRTAP